MVSAINAGNYIMMNCFQTLLSMYTRAAILRRQTIAAFAFLIGMPLTMGAAIVMR